MSTRYNLNRHIYAVVHVPEFDKMNDQDDSIHNVAVIMRKFFCFTSGFRWEFLKPVLLFCR